MRKSVVNLRVYKLGKPGKALGRKDELSGDGGERSVLHVRSFSVSPVVPLTPRRAPGSKPWRKPLSGGHRRLENLHVGVAV